MAVLKVFASLLFLSTKYFDIVNAGSCGSCCNATSVLQGFYPPVFTPADNCGCLNLSVIPIYAKFLKQRGINQVLVSGTTGEGPATAIDNRKRLLDAWMIQAKSLGLNVMMQVGGLPFSDVLKLTAYAARVKVDAVLTLPELYYKPRSVEELVDFVAKVAKKCFPIPILYYNIPDVTGVYINMPEFFRKATLRIPNFAGLKTPPESAFAVIASNTLNCNQTILVSTDTGIASALEQGFNGTISGTASIFPLLVVAIREAVLNCDMCTARKLQLELSRRLADITYLSDAMSETGETIALLKAGMTMVNGIPMGPSLNPLPKVTPSQMMQMAQNLQNRGVPIATRY